MADKLPMSMRTADGERFYQEQKASGTLIPLADEPTLREWKHWRIIDNRFPYSIALRKHHLLLPHRVVADRFWLEPDEVCELDEILAEIAPEYDFVMENFAKRRSILVHYHLHLGEYHDSREQMTL